jgi:8-oxo-dGTP diphosphatase
MSEMASQMTYRNPTPTVDIIIEFNDRIVLIERLNEPYGWALPGGFVEYGETVETAAIREAAEETSLEIRLLEQFYVYSDPARDARKHTISVVFIAEANGTPIAKDDAKAVGLFDLCALPVPLCFDHQKILEDYRHYRLTGQRPSIR